MRTNSVVLSCLLSIITVLSIVPAKAECADYTVDEVNSLVSGIISYKLNETGSGSVQDWIDGTLTDKAGKTSEWYVIALSQYGFSDFSSYEPALLSYISNNKVASATTREKYALALCSAGSTDSYISDVLDNSIGQQGIMSWIYGLHVMNNGYVCSNYDAGTVVDTLLSLQYDDGGWALYGGTGDIDVTAMTINALAPYYDSDPAVHDSVERGLEMLSLRQEDDGGYQSFGTMNPESSAQVLTALSSLGIDCCTDSRFIKNGYNIIDAMERFRQPDGGYSHTLDGGVNESATVQTLYSYIAYTRMCSGKTPLLVMDNRRTPESTPEPHETQETDIRQEETSANTEKAVHTSAVTTVSANVRSTSVSSVTTTASASSTSKVTTKTTSASKTTATSETSEKVSTAETSTVEKSSAESDENEEKGGYKPIAIIIILSTGVLVSLVIFALGKRNYKNFIFIAILAGAGVAVVLMTDISSKESYYSGEKPHKENSIGTVTMTIRCDTIVGKSDSKDIPSDGIILDTTDFEIEDGDTVFDVLTEAAQTYGIQMENTGSSANAHGMVYIAGINYIYEYDFGDLSGWVYHVNGISPSRGCGDYVLSDGDRIEWLYTCELGHDLDEVYEE